MRRPVAAAAALALLLLSASSPASAILVADSSSCAVRCGNVLQSTSHDDLACGDDQFGSFPGSTFESCVECEMDSTYVDSTGFSDLQAVIYNLRYTASYCIFNDSRVAATPCITDFACGHFLEPLDYDDLAVPTAPMDYSYCAGWDDSMLFRCQDCVGQLGGEQYLMNYMTALSASCQQKPPTGSLLSLDGSLFSATAVNISSPLASANAIASTFQPPSGLSLGAKLGIAAGALVALLLVAGCCIVRRGKRRRRAVLAALAATDAMQQVPRWHTDASPQSPQSAGSAAFLAKPANYLWPPQNGSSPASATTTPSSSAGGWSPAAAWSPYNSQHASPVSPVGQGGRAREWPGVPVPPPYRRGSVGSPVAGEGFEMSPLGGEGERERERWAREAGAVGFVPAPAPIIRLPGGRG